MNMPTSNRFSRYFAVLKMLLAVVLLILCAGCSAGGSATQMAATAPAADQGTGSIVARLDWGTAAKSAVKTASSLPSGVVTVRIIISAADIFPTPLRDFQATAGAGTIDGIKAGSGRTLTAQALDASGSVIWQGSSASLTVLAGQVSDAGTVVMQPLSGTATAFQGNIVLGSPTGSSVVANIFSPDQNGTVYLVYGTASGSYSSRTASYSLTAGAPLELPLEGLASDANYYYRLYYQAAQSIPASATAEYSFHTARSAGSSFTFCIQGDSHPERDRNQFNADLYRRTLLTAAADRPDFYLAIGDDFSVDTLDPKTINATQVTERYTIQRPYLGLIGRSAPLFLVNGNHEQAARYLLDGTPNNVAVWAQNARNAHYSQPAPGQFYSGNSEQAPYIGLLRNYFAWTWGDALFVVIDPYWSSPVCVDNGFYGDTKRPSLWEITHGDAQYQWLKNTLEQSMAKYKFVFAHHVMGTGRGGIELAGLYEWGGKNGNGSWGFATYRPAWATPIHQLMVANKVTIFFQGHDHIWARQQLDGVTYQTLPEPADPYYALYNADAFLSGDRFPNTGYTRVNVSPSGVKVDYVRTWLPKDETAVNVSGSVAFSYSIP